VLDADIYPKYLHNSRVTYPMTSLFVNKQYILSVSELLAVRRQLSGLMFANLFLPRYPGLCSVRVFR
jgi:hypothetical protein